MISERSRQVWLLSLPIIGGMMSQNILNLVDAAMVGYLGTPQLAAVGIASFINFVAAAAFMGMSAGVQAMVARRMGEGRKEEAANPLNGALLTILLTATPLAVCLVLYSEALMGWLVDDPLVVQYGSEYLQVRLAAIMFVGMNFCFRGYWSAIKKTGFYLKTLLIVHSLNIFLNYVLIFGKLGFPQLGVQGAALGTSVSMAVGTLIYAYLALKHTRAFGFGLHLPKKETLLTVIKISVPSSMQQLFFALGFTMLFWIVGQIGTAELAAANVLTNITLVAILPCIAFGISAATLVGQALGRSEVEDAHRWAWDVIKVALFVVVLIALPMMLMPELILGVFLKEPHALEVAITPLRLVSLGILVDAFGLVIMNALQGAGATKSTMKVSLLMQWVVFLPLAYIAGPIAGFGLATIWLLQILYRTAQTGIYIYLWQQRQWTNIKI